MPRLAMWSMAASRSLLRLSAPRATSADCTIWYTMTPPVTVSIDVPQPPADVFAFLDVMANHEQFTDHMLTDWQVSGPPTGIGSKAVVTAKAGGVSDRVEFEVVEAEPDRMIKERNKARGGKRVGTGTYVLTDAPD